MALHIYFCLFQLQCSVDKSKLSEVCEKLIQYFISVSFILFFLFDSQLWIFFGFFFHCSLTTCMIREWWWRFSIFYKTQFVFAFGVWMSLWYLSPIFSSWFLLQICQNGEFFETRLLYSQNKGCILYFLPWHGSVILLFLRFANSHSSFMKQFSAYNKNDSTLSKIDICKVYFVIVLKEYIFISFLNLIMNIMLYFSSYLLVFV